ncbi:sensor histidine kinase [Paenibacillus sp. 1P07SE]|uniref:sensor histidine kinase n=1 Tax=Paenibacillus sp. 1P07SE TaxID=3132209 RepID=UPI0039A5051F
MNRYNKVQKQFFQNASHELKTPLMSISGYAEGIRDGVLEGERAAKGLDIIVSESSRMNKIVTEMTLLAKLDSEENSFQPTEVTIKDLITETIERMHPLLTTKELELQVEYPDQDHTKLAVYADRDKLLQALLNVVSNGARYARQTITIDIQLKKDNIHLIVLDDGPGIAEELIPFLFHRFMKGKDGDTGLGLAIARAIVERCGGLISAVNRKDGGAEIAIQLPGAV